MRRIAIRAGFVLCRAVKWSAPAIVLVVFTAVSLAQYKTRSLPHKVLQLTEPKLTGPVSFEQVLAKRRPVLRFADQPVSLSQIGQLAWAGQGIIDPATGLRTAPSPGAVYPMELYFATKDGVFVYNPENHTLEQVFNEDVRRRLAAVSSRPEAVNEAGCDIIIAGSVRKAAVQYAKQARKYLLLEAGHIAQNILLQAVSLDLGSVPVGDFDIREITSLCRLPKGSEPVYMICVGYPAAEPIEGAQAEPTAPRKAVFIVAGANFRDEELFETRLVLENAGVETVIASSRIGPVMGMLGGTAEAMVLMGQLAVDDFDAIIFVGGPGAAEYIDSPVALGIAREAADKGKVLAAICIAPTVLANAGVLKGIKATSLPSERIKLQLAGAEYTGAPVERDGPIITASDPKAAGLFGQAVVDALFGR
ncbi:MAG TPA: DJ-1/PfpI family protein [Sedimentisphaerales bacterium]|nr:DJ-1/PfpI family protein [Sedimentisphaerales bacterium]